MQPASVDELVLLESSPVDRDDSARARIALRGEEIKPVRSNSQFEAGRRSQTFLVLDSHPDNRHTIDVRKRFYPHCAVAPDTPNFDVILASQKADNLNRSLSWKPVLLKSLRLITALLGDCKRLAEFECRFAQSFDFLQDDMADRRERTAR